MVFPEPSSIRNRTQANGVPSKTTWQPGMTWAATRAIRLLRTSRLGMGAQSLPFSWRQLRSVSNRAALLFLQCNHFYVSFILSGQRHPTTAYPKHYAEGLDLVTWEKIFDDSATDVIQAELDSGRFSVPQECPIEPGSSITGQPFGPVIIMESRDMFRAAGTDEGHIRSRAGLVSFAIIVSPLGLRSSQRSICRHYDGIHSHGRHSYGKQCKAVVTAGERQVMLHSLLPTSDFNPNAVPLFEKHYWLSNEPGTFLIFVAMLIGLEPADTA